jgi:putative MATE family efflux protein
MQKPSELSYKAILLFSLPSVMASLLEPMASMVDSALVGHLNTTWLASLALATTLFNSFTWVFNFFVHIPTQNLSYFLSRGEKHKAAEVIKVSSTLALTMGIACTLLLYIFRESLFDLIGASGENREELDSYFGIRVFGQPFTLLYVVLISALRGQSKVKTTFVVLVLSTLLNATLSAVLLYGVKMGIEGAAWGTVLANVLGSLVCLGLILKDKEWRGAFLKMSWPKEVAFSLGANSLNLFLRSLTLTSCFFISTRFIAGMGDLNLAAHQVALNFWLFSSFLIDGFAITANIRGASYFGLKDRESFAELLKKLLVCTTVLGLVFTIVYGVGGRWLWQIFSNDQNIYPILSSIWIWVFLFQVVNAISFLNDGFLFGTADFGYIRKHMIIAGLFVFLPLALWGRYNISMHGIWAGLVALNFYRLVAYYLKVRKYAKVGF